MEYLKYWEQIMLLLNQILDSPGPLDQIRSSSIVLECKYLFG